MAPFIAFAKRATLPALLVLCIFTGSVPAQPAPTVWTQADAAPSGLPQPAARPPLTDQSESKSESSTSPITAGWDNGFFIRSPDKQFELRITGQLQADYRGYENDNDHADVDTFLMRRARLGIEADMYKYYEFRFLPDFGQGQAVVQDAYINIHYWDFFQIEAGKFKQPFSYEQLIQDRFVPSNERSMIDQMVPARDVGAMIHGEKLFGNRLDYAVSISNGEINGNGDDNQTKDVVGRIVVRPFAGWEAAPWLQLFQAGMAATYGIEQEPASPSTLKTPSQVPWFTFNSTVRSDGERYRLCPEVSYFYDAFGAMAEYYFEMHRYSPLGQGSPLDRDVGFEGFQVTATYLLTGEQRTMYAEAIDPLHPFNPCAPLSGFGAWEVLARVSRLKVDSSAFQPGRGQLADPTRNSSGATEMTLGFNWYLNKYVRWQFNWEHDWFDQEVQQATVPPSRYQHQDALLVRLQVIF